MGPCPKCGYSNDAEAVGCAGCGVILAKARPRPEHPVVARRSALRIEHEEEPVPAGRAALRVALAGVLALAAGGVLLGLWPAFEARSKGPNSMSAEVPRPALTAPVAGPGREGPPLAAEDVSYMNELAAKLMRDRTSVPEDDDINRVQALLVPRPENARLRTFLVEMCFRRVATDMRRGASDHAESMLARIRSLDGDSPRLAALEIQARTGPLGSAPERALESPFLGDIQPNVGVAPERERAAPRIDADKAQIQSSTFDVRFDGESQNGVARDVLFILDRAYARLSDVYYDRPNRKIPIVLHSQLDYYTKTGAPFWSGGVYSSHDGAIQIPIKGMPSTLPRDMENVLVHELSHAFVDEMSGGFAGRDLQEGLAQYMEGKRIEGELSPAELKRLANTGRQTVMSFYRLSLVFAQQLVQSRGQTSVNQLLKAMRETGSEDMGFRRTFGQSHTDMQRDIFETFWRRYS